MTRANGIVLMAGIVAAVAIFGNRRFGAKGNRRVTVLVACLAGVACLLLLRGVAPSARNQGGVVHARSVNSTVHVSEFPPAPQMPVVPSVPRVESMGAPGVRTQVVWSDSARAAVSLTSLAGFIALTYLFIDAGRRGRYTWAIRAGSAAAFVGLCVWLMNFGPLASPEL